MPSTKQNAANTRKKPGPVPAYEVIPSASAIKKNKPPVPATESTLFVNSVEKAMRVLAVFNGKQPRLSLSQIAGLAKLDLSAAQRFTFTLSALGYLVKDPFTKTYSLSPRMLDFSYYYLASSELVSRAAPYLRQLSQETEETTNITVLEGTDIIFTLRMISRHVLNPQVITGSRLPAYCTAPGLAIMANLPAAEIDSILAHSNLVAHTPHTIAEPEKIRQRLAAIRQQGYSHTEGEYYLGDISTAAAILDAHGYPMGAVNVAVSRTRWHGRKDEERVSDLVITAAAAISSQF
jgi:DNA-binding IclR family transcriptional regulator